VEPPVAGRPLCAAGNRLRRAEHSGAGPAGGGDGAHQCQLFSDRVARALTTQATQLLAADLVLNGNQPAPAIIRQERSVAA
jgi:hypothetical protein